jgi:hypothetical protein
MEINRKQQIEKDLDRCEDIIDISERLLQTGFKNDCDLTSLNNQLRELKEDLKDQKAKLEKEIFEIAVVGREKAGKSSLLNAWLDFDLLPCEHTRCTYTTTEIRSCCGKEQQKYRIEYFSIQKFKRKLKTLEEDLSKNSENSLLKKEIDEINQLWNEINSHLDKATIEKYFEDFKDVQVELKAAISDPGQARAISKVCIWTNILKDNEQEHDKTSYEANIVLYDVPGYDAPITLHKELTKEKIKSVDAILFAKLFRQPDLVEPEIDILSISEKSNQYIKFNDKIIVALTCCDLVSSPQEYNDLVAKNNTAWNEWQVNPSRIIPICSIAELNSDSIAKKTVMTKLQSLNNGRTGFLELKNAVRLCVEESRNNLAMNRCSKLKERIVEFNRRLSAIIKFIYNIDFKNENLNEIEIEKIYSDWWMKVFLKEISTF